MTTNNSITPSQEGFASDPLGYGSLAWHKWAMVQTLAGFPVDLEKGPSSNDLKSPTLWLSHAHAMSVAATTLLRADPPFDSMPESVRGISHCQYHGIALMLVGYSLEVCLKAMIIIKIGEDAYQAQEKQHRHHRLENLAEFIPELSDKDKAILKGLSHYVRWAGRYPDPGFGKESQADEIFTLAEKHKITAEDIFILSSRIMNYTTEILDKK
jgi:hypothetical protein